MEEEEWPARKEKEMKKKPSDDGDVQLAEAALQLAVS